MGKIILIFFCVVCVVVVGIEIYDLIRVRRKKSLKDKYPLTFAWIEREGENDLNKWVRDMSEEEWSKKEIELKEHEETKRKKSRLMSSYPLCYKSLAQNDALMKEWVNNKSEREWSDRDKFLQQNENELKRKYPLWYESLSRQGRSLLNCWIWNNSEESWETEEMRLEKRDGLMRTIPLPYKDSFKLPKNDQTKLYGGSVKPFFMTSSWDSRSGMSYIFDKNYLDKVILCRIKDHKLENGTVRKVIFICIQGQKPERLELAPKKFQEQYPSGTNVDPLSIVCRLYCEGGLRWAATCKNKKRDDRLVEKELLLKSRYQGELLRSKYPLAYDSIQKKGSTFLKEWILEKPESSWIAKENRLKKEEQDRAKIKKQQRIERKGELLRSKYPLAYDSIQKKGPTFLNEWILDKSESLWKAKETRLKNQKEKTKEQEDTESKRENASRRGLEKNSNVGSANVPKIRRIPLIEKNTVYAKKINYTSASFMDVRNLAMSLIDDSVNADEVFKSLERGTAILLDEQQLFQYLRSYGRMHEAKLISALDDFPFDDLDGCDIGIYDWGCGQGIASMVFKEYAEKQDVSMGYNRVVLIEPSMLALKRAALHVRHFYGDCDLRTVAKDLDSVGINDISGDDSDVKIHLLSNVLDMDTFSLPQLIGLIKRTQKGTNYFICVSPYITDARTNRLDKFVSAFRGCSGFENICDIDDMNDEWINGWTRVVRVFKVTL